MQYAVKAGEHPYTAKLSLEAFLAPFRKVQADHRQGIFTIEVVSEEDKALFDRLIQRKIIAKCD